MPSAPEPSQCALHLMSCVLGFGKMWSVNLIYFLAKGKRQLTSLWSLTKVAFLPGKPGGRVVSPRMPAGLLPEFCQSPSALPTLTLAGDSGGYRASHGRVVGVEREEAGQDPVGTGWGCNPSPCLLGLLPPGCSLPVPCPLLGSLPHPTPPLSFRGAPGEKVVAPGLSQGPRG